MLFRTIIIGLGKIGFGNRNYYKYRSHYYSIINNRNFKIVGLVDSDIKKILKKKIDKKLKIYSSVKEITSKELDLAVIATPTNTHFEVLSECIKKFRLKYILIEKPLGGDFDKAKIFRTIAKKKKIKIFINYFRISLPAVVKLKKILKKKKIVGEILYCNGLINNGSHFINLCQYLFGKIENIKVLKKKKINKFDINSSFILKFKYAKINFNYHNRKNKYHHISFINNNFNIFWQKGKNIMFQNKLKNKQLELKANLDKYQYYVVKNLDLNFRNKRSNLCSIDDGIKTLDIINYIKNAKI